MTFLLRRETFKKNPSNQFIENQSKLLEYGVNPAFVAKFYRKREKKNLAKRKLGLNILNVNQNKICHTYKEDVTTRRNHVSCGGFWASGETRLVSWQGNLNGIAAMVVFDPFYPIPDRHI